MNDTHSPDDEFPRSLPGRRNLCKGVDLYQQPGRQPTEKGRAGRIGLLEVVRKRLVEFGKSLGSIEEHPQHEHVFEIGARRGQDRLNVAQRLKGLRVDGSTNQRFGMGVDPDLAGNLQGVADADSL